MSYPTTVTEFKETLFQALYIKTGYWNKYPFNLGYYHANGVFTFDCVNLLKAILNGWYENRTVGYFQRDLSRTGDCDEYGLITQCSNVSSDFSKLKKCSVLYMPGHIGCFVQEYERNGKIFNVIECTSGTLGDGVISSYVDGSGRRLSEKGGKVQSGKWTLHGTMEKWLKYDDEKIDYQKAIRIAMKIEKGEYGNNPERKEYIINKFGRNYYDAAQGVINYLHTNH